MMFYLAVWTMDVWETLLVAHAAGLQVSFSGALFTEAVLSAVRLGAFFLPGGIGIKDVGYAAIFSSLQVGSVVRTGVFILLKRLVGILCVVVGYAVLLHQGVGPIWSRSSAAFQAVRENV